MLKVLNKPDWLKIRPPKTETFAKIKNALHKRNLVTVCEESHCPNMSECWDKEGTATFMVLGDTCTRACRFCNVKTAFPAQPVDKDEPQKIADAIAEMQLDYAVITSVDRDDLPDEGSGHFAECIRAIKKAHPTCLVEVLIPDFKGNKEFIKKIIDAKPDVIAHNIETVERLQRKVRDPRANFVQSISVLDYVKETSSIFTKSSIMLGLGETKEEVIDAMKELRKHNVDIFTIGQYLRPSEKHLPVLEYVHPDIFKLYEEEGKKLGFKYIASGPFVRSSYRAGELYVKSLKA
ncbi:MAG: lipoyl synthase [Candidatus Nanoarchaeia archaeon]